MIIPCKEIAETIENGLFLEVEQLKKLGKTPKLLTILIGESSEQTSFVTIKQKVAERLGVGFEFVHFPQTPEFSVFISFLKEKSADPAITGIIVQQPLPDSFKAEEMYQTIPVEKEIEGHRADSHLQFPLSLSVLTGIKYVYNRQQINKKSIVNFDNDIYLFKDLLKGKNIVIAGRGPTGGKPIAEALTDIEIPFTVIHSKTENSEEFYKNADIIITATGKKIISPEMLKSGVVLLNVGLREENGFLKGDYSEKEIQDIAGFYTKTPGGLGPIDVLYLYKNLIDATKNHLS